MVSKQNKQLDKEEFVLYYSYIAIAIQKLVHELKFVLLFQLHSPRHSQHLSYFRSQISHIRARCL